MLKKIFKIFISIILLLTTFNGVVAKYYIPGGLDWRVNPGMPGYGWVDYDFVLNLISGLKIDESLLNMPDNLSSSDFSDTYPLYQELINLLEKEKDDNDKANLLLEIIKQKKYKDFITKGLLNTFLIIEHNGTTKRNPGNSLGLFQNNILEEIYTKCKENNNYKIKESIYLKDCNTLFKVYTPNNSINRIDVLHQVGDLVYRIYKDDLFNTTSIDGIYDFNYNMALFLKRIRAKSPKEEYDINYYAEAIKNEKTADIASFYKHNSDLFKELNINNTKDLRRMKTIFELAIFYSKYKGVCSIDGYCDENGMIIEQTNVFDNYYLVNYRLLDIYGNNNKNYKRDGFLPVYLSLDKSTMDKNINIFAQIAKVMLK